MNWRDRAKEAVEKNRGGTAPTKPTKQASVSFVSTPPPPFPAPKAGDYTLADLQELDRLIRELGGLEGRTDAEIDAMLSERRRMAPTSVPGALEAISAAHRAALAPWPEPPAKRSKVVLCVIEGGKGKKPYHWTDSDEPEAA